MSLIDLSDDKRPSPGLSLNLSSNNPFRNRAASPSFPSPNSAGSARPVSRNPFLDSNIAEPTTIRQQTRSTSPQKMSLANDVSGPQRPAEKTADLFDSLTLDDKPKPRPSTNGRTSSVGPARPENVPPRSSVHRPSRSQEEAMRARKAAGSSSRRAPSGELDIFADPSDPPKKSSASHRRRNSDSSTIKAPETDEERRRRRREREKRHRERESKDPKTRKPPKNLDIIDKLDVTSIYGTGLFHHDGPFDACNPHRNRQGSRRAPMQAFPKDSLNNVMGGGPLNKRPDHATFLGNNNDEAFKDYAAEAYGNGAIRPDGPARQASLVVNPLAPEPIHGDESLGLGTSTFLEGTPASREAIARRQQEVGANALDGGLARKKSLAQKIRGIRNERRDYGPSGRMTSPDGIISPGYTPGGTRRPETNPFASEFSSTMDKKQESGITIAEPERSTSHVRSPSSPKRFGDSLQRRATSDGSDGAVTGESSKPSGGFLSRVKSLKGGPRKPRDQKTFT